MKVLVVATEFPPGPGGIGTHAYQLTTYLHRQGWQVHLVTGQAYVSQEVRDNFNRSLPFAVTPLVDKHSGWRRMGRQWQQLRRVFTQLNPDVLVATGNRAAWAVAGLTTLRPRPWLLVGHGSEFLASHPVARFLMRWATRQATTVVAVSRYTAQLIRQSGVAPRQLAIIPNGADGTRFQSGLDTTELRQQHGLTGKQILLTVGHVSERKAQDVVIRALPQMVRRCPNVVYLMAGLPTRRTELTQLAQNLGVADHIRFAGVVSDEQLPLYYNLCDLFVLVSRQGKDGAVEGYGIVVIEAALCGKPAVVSKGSGLQEAVHDGETGLTVAPEAVNETADAVLCLLEDSALRHRLGQQALTYARQGTWEARMHEYEQLLQKLVTAA